MIRKRKSYALGVLYVRASDGARRARGNNVGSMTSQIAKVLPIASSVCRASEPRMRSECMRFWSQRLKTKEMFRRCRIFSSRLGQVLENVLRKEEGRCQVT